MKIPLAKPQISEEDITAVTGVLKSGRLALGPMAVEFEKVLATRVGVSHGVAVSSGTAGLHLLLLALGVGPGHEVITTPFSFVASSNAILYVGAVPVFVDIDPQSLCIDPSAVEEAVTPRTRAILAVDVFGHPADYDALGQIARAHGLLLIGDSCEALGSELRGVPVGNPQLADAAVFAFYPNKQITTGEGGCVVTDDAEVSKLIGSLRNQGRGHDGQWLVHERLGYNYRLDELSAALGLSQLRRLDQFLEQRSAVAALYEKRLSPLVARGLLDLQGVDSSVTKMSWFVYVVRVDRQFEPFYQIRFGHRSGAFPIAEDIGARSIALPFFNDMSAEQVDYVGTALEDALFGRIGAGDANA